jgi:DNA helicase-2/ATP-dependent DNA helicase PcrA
MREPAVPSVFLSELPPQLLQGDLPRSGGTALRREQRLDRLTRVDRPETRQIASGGAAGQPANAVRRRAGGARVWAVGDRLLHSAFGEGEVTHLFGSGEKISIAVKFPGMGAKILDPRLAPIEPLHGDPH